LRTRSRTQLAIGWGTYPRLGLGSAFYVRHPKFGSGHQTVRYYDADQNPDSFTDADGNKTAYVYDLANQ
jgi:hypothetical protein